MALEKEFTGNSLYAEVIAEFDMERLAKEKKQFDKEPEIKAIAFVSGKFRGKNHWEIHNNVLKAEAVIPKLTEMGYAPVVPHKITEHFQGLFPDKTYLDMCLMIIRALKPGRDIIYLLKEWRDSKGAVEEYYLAKDLGIETVEEI